jgi:hypothetical protein
MRLRANVFRVVVRKRFLRKGEGRVRGRKRVAGRDGGRGAIYLPDIFANGVKG